MTFCSIFRVQMKYAHILVICLCEKIKFPQEEKIHTNVKTLKEETTSKLIPVHFSQHKLFVREHILFGSLGLWSSLFQEIVVKASFYRCNQVAYHKHQLPSIHPGIAGKRNTCKNIGIHKHKKTATSLLLHYKAHWNVLHKKTVELSMEIYLNIYIYIFEEWFNIHLRIFWDERRK